MLRFMFAVGIECSCPLIDGNQRVDQLESTGHYQLWQTDLKLVRELRDRGATLPVIVLGPYSAFRTAVEIARLEATDFLERPVSARQLRTAVSKAC